MCCSPRISCNGWRTRSVVHDVGSEALTFDGRTASGGGGGGGGTAAVAAGDQPAQRIDTGGQGDIAVAAGAVEEARNDVSWPHRFVGGGLGRRRQEARCEPSWRPRRGASIHGWNWTSAVSGEFGHARRFDAPPARAEFVGGWGADTERRGGSASGGIVMGGGVRARVSGWGDRTVVVKVWEPQLMFSPATGGCLQRVTCRACDDLR